MLQLNHEEISIEPVFLNCIKPNETTYKWVVMGFGQYINIWKIIFMVLAVNIEKREQSAF